MISWVTAAWRSRRHRREWGAERQLEHVRQLVLLDHRWLAHDKTADELTARYLKALNEHWYRIGTEDIRLFRERIGLDPHKHRAEKEPKHG